MDRDGFLEFTISDDSMNASGNFMPALGEGRDITRDYVESVLDGKGIVYGIDWEAVQEAVFYVTTEKRAKNDVIIARGTAPKPEVPQHYSLVERSTESVGDLNSDRVDFKKISRLKVIQARDVIARLIPAQEGEAGHTVLGNELPWTVEQVPSPVPGKNTREEDGRVFAVLGGQLVISEREFYIEDRIEISGAVGFETGSIEFPGDVVLRGEVKDGFHIWVGGSIESHVTVDVSEIYCRGEFSSKGGLVGRGGTGLLRAGGSVQARFIGNCNVESKSSVYVKDYVYQAHMASLDRLAMGKGGRIIGGVITTAKGIRCKELGNKAHVSTLVRTGMDFIAERQHRITREKLEAVGTKLTSLRNKLPANPSDRQVDILHKLDAARLQLVEQLGLLTGRLDIDEEAVIEVDGTVFPGVTVQICRASFNVEEQMAKVRFYLEKRSGRVISMEMTE